MLGVLIILAAAAICVAILYFAIREWGNVEPSIWQPMSMLFAGRIVGRLFNAVVPDLDSFTRLGLGMLIYILVISGMLTFWTKVPPIRSLLLAIGIAFFMIIAGFVAVAYLPANQPYPSALNVPPHGRVPRPPTTIHSTPAPRPRGARMIVCTCRPKPAISLVVRSPSSLTRMPAKPRSPRSCCCTAARLAWQAP